jgi:hypothetical protein
MSKLSPTRAQLGGRCYRRHALTNVATLARRARVGVGTKRSNPAAAFGTVIHSMAAAWWLSQDPVQSLDALDRAWAEEFASESTGDYSLEMARAIAEGYHRQAELVPLVPGNFVLNMVENRLVVPIGPHTLSFKVDRLLSETVPFEKGGRLVFVDTKTAGRLGPSWSRQWPLSLQMKLYKLGMYLLFGTIPDGVIEGVLKKVPTKLEPVLLPDWTLAELEEAQEQFLKVANKDDRIVKLATHDGVLDTELLWDLASTVTEFNDNDCFSYGNPCPFLEVCQSAPGDRVGLIATEYETYEPEDY